VSIASIAAFTATAWWMMGTSPAYPSVGGGGPDVDGHLLPAKGQIEQAREAAAVLKYVLGRGHPQPTIPSLIDYNIRAIYARSGRIGAGIGARIEKSFFNCTQTVP
jgi:hypothetical protein